MPIGLSSITSDYFKGIKSNSLIIVCNIPRNIKKKCETGFFIMAFSDNSSKPIGKFSIDVDGQSMSCFNGMDVRTPLVFLQLKSIKG